MARLYFHFGSNSNVRFVFGRFIIFREISIWIDFNDRIKLPTDKNYDSISPRIFTILRHASWINWFMVNEYSPWWKTSIWNQDLTWNGFRCLKWQDLNSVAFSSFTFLSLTNYPTLWLPYYHINFKWAQMLDNMIVYFISFDS